MKRAQRGSLVALVGFVVLIPWLWATSATAAPNPPGNNGTVKVEGEELDHLHDNDPHVGCEFFVQWYGFDLGTRTTTVTFTAQDPTGDGETLLTDTFTFEGSGSGNALDAQRAYDLTAALAGYTPHPQQGFHVKLTVETDFSQGADVKHKVFWVSGCAETEATSTTTTSTTTTTTTTTTTVDTSSTTPTSESIAPTTAGAVSGDSSVAAAGNQAAPAVLGEQTTRATGELARTGNGVLSTLALAGLGLVLVGAAMARVDRHRARRGATS